LNRSDGNRNGGEDRIADLLRSCRGFRVESPQGPVGIVESVAFISSLTAPDALLVRVGLFARELVVIPRREVTDIVISGRQVVVRSHASVHSLSHLASAAAIDGYSEGSSASATDGCPEGSTLPRSIRGRRQRGSAT
jgi:hypothetical protein